MNKKGQFFLIAALVIVAILFGLSTVYTTVETPSEDQFVYDLSKEIKYESNTVIDSGIFNALTEQQRNENVENLTDHYSSSNLGTDFIVVYGNKTEMTALFYTTQNTGSIGINLGGSEILSHTVDQTRKYNSTFSLNETDHEVTVLIDQDVKYTFKVRPGQMFFIILKKERQGEQFVSASREG
jgi:hypothetical protein